MGSATVKCNGCGEVSDAEDVHCRCPDMRQKTISFSMEVARRFETGSETAEDAAWLRRTLAARWPDMIF